MTNREAESIGVALWEGIINGGFTQDEDGDCILWNTCISIINTTSMTPARAALMGKGAGLTGDECDRLAAHAAGLHPHF